MRLNLYPAALMLFIASAAIASPGNIHSSSDRSEVRYITNSKRLPDEVYQAELRNRSNWQGFLQNNGTWYVTFNEENARPHRAYGQPVQVFGATVEDKAMNFINGKLSGFNIPVSDLQYSSTVLSGRYDYVNYKQQYHGLEVLNSRMVVKMTPAGSVVMFGADVFTDIEIDVNPVLSSSAALAAAKTGLDANVNITSATIGNDLKVLPIPYIKSNKYKLVYEATVETMDAEGIPAIYYTLVDANDGKVLYRQNKVKHLKNKMSANTDVAISGTVYTSNPYNASSVVPLRNLKMVSSATTYYTDSLGYIGLANTSSVSATFSLEGKWSKVLTGNTTPTFTATLNPGTNALTFDNNANIRELSGYYHVNIVHDYMKTKYPSFTMMDNALPTNIDVTAGNCNAFYNGSSINFYAAGNNCNCLSQVGDVVYHEYGHGINDKFYQSQGGSFDNGAMGEGYADIWALGITASPVLGIGFSSVDATEYVRRYDMDIKVYPQDLVGEVHADGEIIAGAWWDTHIYMGNNLQGMMDLFSQTFYGLVTGPDGQEGQIYTDILIEALQADDVPPLGDNNISNGTPNDWAIVTGFDKHGITLLSNASLTTTPVLASLPNNPVTIDATLTNLMFPWALAGVKLYYKINRLGSWTSMNMTNTSGNNYQGNIPPQPQGTVIAYYVGLADTSGKLSAVQPIAAADTNPNIPYFVLNGFALRDHDDFDGNNLFTGLWTPGLPSDNATTGIWEVGIPIGSYSTVGDPNSIVQPDQQLTPGGSACAYTGNANNTSAALGTNDVDGGETTLESPSLDLSGYTNPAITYHRWYINNPPTGANPANDFWEVQISSDGINWVKVERTNVSDKSWRRYAFRVTDYVPLSSDVKIRFVAEDSLIPSATLSGGSIVEAAIDEISLYEEGVTGIEEAHITYMQAYPNPATGDINLKFDVAAAQEMDIQMVNALGQLVYNESYLASSGLNRTKISTASLPAGVYMLTLRNGKTMKMEKVTLIK
jgi:hypothetical protein